MPFTTRSLTKLVDYLATGAWITVGRETVRQVLRAAGVSWQATKTWKASKDPDFVAEKDRVLDLYDHPPTDGRVLCVDEPDRNAFAIHSKIRRPDYLPKAS